MATRSSLCESGHQWEPFTGVWFPTQSLDCNITVRIDPTRAWWVFLDNCAVWTLNFELVSLELEDMTLTYPDCPCLSLTGEHAASKIAYDKGTCPQLLIVWNSVEKAGDRPHWTWWKVRPSGVTQSQWQSNLIRRFRKSNTTYCGSTFMFLFWTSTDHSYSLLQNAQFQVSSHMLGNAQHGGGVCWW